MATENSIDDTVDSGDASNMKGDIKYPGVNGSMWVVLGLTGISWDLTDDAVQDDFPWRRPSMHVRSVTRS